jgi:hypothetical protein
MSITRLPLPLELTSPVLLAGDLNTQLRRTYGSTTYDPKTQLCWGGFGGSESEQESESSDNFLVIDVTIDLQIDDNDF